MPSLNQDLIKKIIKYSKGIDMLRTTITNRTFMIESKKSIIERIRRYYKYVDYDFQELNYIATIKIYLKLIMTIKCILCSNRLYLRHSEGNENKIKMISGVMSPVCGCCIKNGSIFHEYTSFDSPEIVKPYNHLKCDMLLGSSRTILHNRIYSNSGPLLNTIIYGCKVNALEQELYNIFLKCIVCKKIVSCNQSRDINDVNLVYETLRKYGSYIQLYEQQGYNPEEIKRFIVNNCLNNYNCHLNYKGISFTKTSQHGLKIHQNSFIHTCCIGRNSTIEIDIMDNFRCKRAGIRNRDVVIAPFSRPVKLKVLAKYIATFPREIPGRVNSRGIQDVKCIHVLIGKCQACRDYYSTRFSEVDEIISGLCTCTSKKADIDIFLGDPTKYPYYDEFNNIIKDYAEGNDNYTSNLEEISERINDVTKMRQFVRWLTQTYFIPP
jgi:hypothetical protein